MLRGRGTECFVVTPFHVVDGSLGAIAIVGDAAVRAQSQLERRFASDVAVLRVEAAPNLGCSGWPSAPNVDGLLARHGTGFMLTRESDGSLSLYASSVAGERH